MNIDDISTQELEDELFRRWKKKHAKELAGLSNNEIIRRWRRHLAAWMNQVSREKAEKRGNYGNG